MITSRKLTHEQKLTNLAGQADSLLEVLDLPDGLEDLLEPVEGKQCICVSLRLVIIFNISCLVFSTRSIDIGLKMAPSFLKLT